MRNTLPLVLFGLALLCGCARKSPPPARRAQVLPEGDWQRNARGAIERGLAFLKARDGDGDGRWEVQTGFGPVPSAGISAVSLLAFFQSPAPVSEKTHPALWKGLRWLESLQKPNGSIYEEQEGNANYVTSVAILAMVLSGDPRFRPVVDRARDCLVASQTTEGIFAGGFGYQDKAKIKDEPYNDIVNTEFAIEALKTAGLPEDHPVFERAVGYLERCQHNSEYNKAAWVSDIGEYRGGFVYHPGESKAEKTTGPDGREILLPYGSVTYAGIKSMIYAHLTPDDPRVRAAVDWIRRHWTLDENPGFDVQRDRNLGKQGYFYYFTTFAKALNALGEEVVEDDKFVKHPWRRELVSRIVGLQKPDGSWKNEWHDRWFESVEELSTAYAVIALSYALMGQ